MHQPVTSPRSRYSIEVEGLRKAYGPVAALHDVSFRVESGAIVGLLGGNGAGKTTTIAILLGLVLASGGRCASSASTPSPSARKCSR
jgi:ABC-type multidrug transport system ATPase subunit